MLLTGVIRNTRVAVLSLFAVIIMTVAMAYSGEKRPISGNLTGLLDPGDYRVTSTITVPAGDTLGISAGTSLYFEPLTGIDVSGGLTIEGAYDSPVILTSVNDSVGSSEAAQAFDWNGIKVAPSSVICLRRAWIKNSVYGVKVKDATARVELADIVFLNNGYAALVRGDDAEPIVSGEPFSVRWNVEASQETVDREAKDKRRHKSGGRLAFNVGAVGIAAVGVVVSGVGLSRMDADYGRYIATRRDGESAGRYEKKVWGDMTMSAVGVVVTGAALACVGVSLFF